jgi:hypothetical protein
MAVRLSALRASRPLLPEKSFDTHFCQYGAEIWGCASKSNISIIQRSQSKILRMIVNAPWYVRNITLQENLNVPLVKEVVKQRSTRYHNKIEGHVNVLIQPLLEPHNERRLKKELANRPTRRLMRTYFWISLFTSYRIKAN